MLQCVRDGWIWCCGLAECKRVREGISIEGLDIEAGLSAFFFSTWSKLFFLSSFTSFFKNTKHSMVLAERKLDDKQFLTASRRWTASREYFYGN